MWYCQKLDDPALDLELIKSQRRIQKKTEGKQTVEINSILFFFSICIVFFSHIVF